MRTVFLFSLVLIAMFIVGCSSDIDLEATPDLRLGEDVCAQCGMIISEEAYAAAFRLSDGKRELFDDVGDMVVRYRLNNPDVAAFWAHDFNSKQWIRAENAYFVASDDLVTPMGHGIAAFVDLDSAESLADDLNGAVHTLQELLAQPISELPRHHHDDEMSTEDDGMMDHDAMPMNDG